MRPTQVWALFCLALACVVVISCYTVTQFDDPPIPEGPRNNYFAAVRLGSAEDTLYQYRTRGDHRIASPQIQVLLYYLTAQCAGIEPEVPVEWREAAAIFRLPNENEPKGSWVVGLFLEGDVAHTIILDQAYVTHPGVLSHESLHALSGLGDGDPEFVALQERCEIGYTSQEVRWR